MFQGPTYSLVESEGSEVRVLGCYLLMILSAEFPTSSACAGALGVETHPDTKRSLVAYACAIQQVRARYD